MRFRLRLPWRPSPLSLVTSRREKCASPSHRPGSVPLIDDVRDHDIRAICDEASRVATPISRRHRDDHLSILERFIAVHPQADSRDWRVGASPLAGRLRSRTRSRSQRKDATSAIDTCFYWTRGAAGLSLWCRPRPRDNPFRVGRSEAGVSGACDNVPIRRPGTNGLRRPQAFTSEYDDVRMVRALRELFTSLVYVRHLRIGRRVHRVPTPDLPPSSSWTWNLPIHQRSRVSSNSLAPVPPPIVFITGHGDIPSSVRAIKAGAVDFSAKPFASRSYGAV